MESDSKRQHSLPWNLHNIFLEWIPNQIKNNNTIKNKIKLDEFRNNGKRKNLSGIWGEILDELHNRNCSVYGYCINSIYVLCKYFLNLMQENSK